MHCRLDVHTTNVPEKCLVTFVREGKTFFHPFTFRAWIAVYPSRLGTAIYVHTCMELYISAEGTADARVSRTFNNNISIESHFQIEDLRLYLGKYLFHLCKVRIDELAVRVKAILESVRFEIEEGSSSLPQLIAVDMIIDHAGTVYPLQYHEKSFATPNNRVGQTVFHDHFALVLYHRQHADEHLLAGPLQDFHRFRLVSFHRNGE